ILLYPNPTKDSIRLLAPAGEYQVKLFTVDGRMCLLLEGNLTTINQALTQQFRDLSAGLYHFVISDASGKLTTFKAIKQ
ncbi:MAG: T9SS type A sorting domain-containing protein, partial [Bacteroidia bacterium]|nr:T9SS type A sorting domain-containing protein [Bacteroidia bacterium]